MSSCIYWPFVCVILRTVCFLSISLCLFFCISSLLPLFFYYLPSFHLPFLLSLPCKLFRWKYIRQLIEKYLIGFIELKNERHLNIIQTFISLKYFRMLKDKWMLGFPRESFHIVQSVYLYCSFTFWDKDGANELPVSHLGYLTQGIEVL
jgi:hypothetical protein